MDSTPLLDAASALVAQLPSFGVSVVDGVLLRTEEDGQWHLVLATPEVASLGPLEVYKRIESASKTLPAPPTKLAISVVHPDNDFIKNIKETYQAPRPKAVQLKPPSSVSTTTSAVTFGAISTLIYPAWDKPPHHRR